MLLQFECVQFVLYHTHVPMRQVSASGGDDDQITYSIAGNQNGRFAINAITGQIDLVKKLDRETVPEVRLKVWATDNGNFLASDLHLTPTNPPWDRVYFQLTYKLVNAHVPTHGRQHIRTHTRKHTRTHGRTHTHTHLLHSKPSIMHRKC